MMSKFDDSALRVNVSEGKRHYLKEKKTSIFGSETPRNPTNYSNNYRNTNVKSLEDNILSQNEIVMKDRIYEDAKYKSAAEKRATLRELESYDPWGKPGAGAANVNLSQDHNSSRAKWQYEQELKKINDYKKSDGNSYPGFAPGFGSGNSKKDGRRRSETSSNNGDVRQNLYYPFGSSGASAPITEDYQRSQEADGTMYRNDSGNNNHTMKLEEAKAYAEHLEKEIQRMKLKQMEDRYSSAKNSSSGTNYDKFDNNTTSEYEDDAFYREAENRARLRELERLKESYDHQNSTYENDFMNNDRNEPGYDHENYDEYKQLQQEPERKDGPKRVSSSSTHNDYRPYSMDEYMNSRQQLVNPTHVKRTTLSGSEEVRQNGKYRNGDSNQSLNPIDEDRVAKQPNINTYNNIFPSERNLSASKPGRYAMKTPYATD